jgi:hypothetical protein
LFLAVLKTPGFTVVMRRELIENGIVFNIDQDPPGFKLRVGPLVGGG